MLCKWCNKEIKQKIKHDWSSRKYHKKCWKSFEDYAVWVGKQKIELDCHSLMIF